MSPLLLAYLVFWDILGCLACTCLRAAHQIFSDVQSRVMRGLFQKLQFVFLEVGDGGFWGLLFFFTPFLFIIIFLVYSLHELRFESRNGVIHAFLFVLFAVEQPQRFYTHIFKKAANCSCHQLLSFSLPTELCFNTVPQFLPASGHSTCFQNDSTFCADVVFFWWHKEVGCCCCTI